MINVDMIPEMVEKIKTDFKNYYCKKQVDNLVNRDKLRAEIDQYFSKVQAEGHLGVRELAGVKVTSSDDGQIIVDLMSAFKNCSKEEQEEIFCKMHNLSKDKITRFIYNNEGYIDGVYL